MKETKRVKTSYVTQENETVKIRDLEKRTKVVTSRLDKSPGG
jgi:hypothetical protein